MTTPPPDKQPAAETLVRKWANFHPDIPLTRSYADLVRRIEQVFVSARGCEHCNCPCVDCASCGSPEGEQ